MIFDEKNLIREYGLPVEKPKIKINESEMYESDLRNKLKLLMLGQKFAQQAIPVKEEKATEEPAKQLWEEVKEAANGETPQESVTVDPPKDVNKEILRLMKKYRSEKDPSKKEELRRRIAELKKLKQQPPQEQPPSLSKEHLNLLEEVNNMSEGVILMEVIKHKRDLFVEYSQGKVEKDKVLKEGKVLILISRGLTEDEARKLVGD